MILCTECACAYYYKMCYICFQKLEEQFTKEMDDQDRQFGQYLLPNDINDIPSSSPPLRGGIHTLNSTRSSVSSVSET